MSETGIAALRVLNPGAIQDRTSLVVAVCTYRRNEPLRVLLQSVLAGASEVLELAAVGVVIVDDNPDGSARTVADEFSDRFELGVQYRHSGKRNLAVARNLSLETGARVADWVLMTDDDCEPPRGWLRAHLIAQQQTGCDATTGAMLLRAPPGAPRWLTEQPFFRDYEIEGEDLQPMDATGTNNVMIRSTWLLAHPELRFREDLGRSGGEDWVFFRSACNAGLTLRFARDASTMGNESEDRLTWRYLLRNRLWLGNCEYFVNSLLEEEPRSVLRHRARTRLVENFRRFLEKPREFRYSAAVLARNLGYVLAILGVRLRHH